MFKNFDNEYCRHFFICKYIVLTEDFDNSIDLNVNPWRRGESTRHAVKVRNEIEREWTNKKISESLNLFRVKNLCPEISYEDALAFYERNKKEFDYSSSVNL